MMTINLVNPRWYRSPDGEIWFGGLYHRAKRYVEAYDSMLTQRGKRLGEMVAHKPDPWRHNRRGKMLAGLDMQPVELPKTPEDASCLPLRPMWWADDDVAKEDQAWEPRCSCGEHGLCPRHYIKPVVP